MDILLGKKLDEDALKAQTTSVTNDDIAIEKGSYSVSLSTPPAHTCGHDAIAVRSSSVSGSTSALDLIKKKLQDTGIPDSSSPGPALSGSGTLVVNGTKPMETTKVLQNDNNKGNIGDGDMSNSEDEDGGPAKEGCVLQCKDVFNKYGPTFKLLSNLSSNISLEERGSTQFSRQAARISNVHHSNILRNISSVWIIRCVEGREDGDMMLLTGFCVDKRGLLLTCAHGIINGWKLTVSIDDDKFYDAKVLKKSDDWDMALLMVEANDEQFDVVSFVDENYEIKCGQEVHVLGHPDLLMGSFYSWMVGYPFRGYDFKHLDALEHSVGDEEESDANEDVGGEEDEEEFVRCRFQRVEDHRRAGNTVPILGLARLDRNENLPLIQINNIPCITGASGSPIFSNSGLVVGMYQSGLGNVQRAIHFSALRRFFEIGKRKIE